MTDDRGGAELDARLDRLREATGGITATAQFTARVVDAAAALPPRRPAALARAWWSVPAAAIVAAGALAWAFAVHADVERAHAARDIAAALAYPDGFATARSAGDPAW
jgi:hypothetical protein